MLKHSLRPSAAARRIASLALSLAAGLLGSAMLFLALAWPVWAAPAAVDRPYPGAAPCNTSLQACIDGATAGDTIVIQAGTYVTSFTLNKAVSLTGVSSATVILHALPDTRVLEVTGAAISNSVVISGLTFTGGSLAGSNCSASCGGGVLLASSAQPLLVNVIITGNSAWDGGGLYAASGSLLRMTNSQVLSNTSGNAGGGALVIGAAMLNGGLFQGNQCTQGGCQGGGLQTFSTLALTGTQFLSNSASAAGGGVSAFGAATLNGGLFQGNAASQGGGLFANDTLALTGTQFFSNTTSGDGGGALAIGAVLLNGGLFQGNQCTLDGCEGGGLHTIVTLTLTGTQFLGNSARLTGGGVLAGGATVLNGGLFQGNQCALDGCTGGGLHVSGGNVSLTGTQFLSNTARFDGGGVHANGAVVVNGGLFQANQCTQASCSGGGLSALTSVALSGTQFISNASNESGGGAYSAGATVLNGGLFQANQCSQDDCQGGGLYTISTLTLTGTQYLSNSARLGGGGVLAGGAGVLNGGLFQGNVCTQADCQGGGLRSLGISELALTGTQFLGNSASGAGGGVSALGAAMLNGGLFRGNVCTEDVCTGGGLYTGDRLSLVGTQFLSNSARLGGGGVYALAGVVLNGGLFQGNDCTLDGCTGGGLYAGGLLRLTDTQFIGNTAQSDGGGALANNSARLNGGLFQGNECTQDDCTGGGLHVSLGSFTTLDLTGTQFLSNTARQGGGGVYTFAGAVLNAGLFRGNTCTRFGCVGGGLHHDGPFTPLTLTNMQFISNSAHAYGGGVLAGGPTMLTGGLFQGNAASRGGGLSGFNTLALTGTHFVSNTAISDGGGVVALTQLLLNGGLFQGNAAAWGGALSQTGGAGQITNTLFANNTAVNGGAAIYLAAPDGVSLVHNTISMSATQLITPAVHIANGSVGITNTLFTNHATGIHRTGGSAYQDYNLFSGVTTPTSGGVSGGANSLTGAAGFSDPSAGDYRLTAASDAIDAGADAGVYADFFGTPRPLGDGFDIGYHEVMPIRLYFPIVMR